MRGHRLGVLLLVLGGALAHPVRADFEVRSADPFLKERVLHVNTQFDLVLSPRTEEALNKGIPLEIVFDISLVRHRWWWANKVIADWTLQRRIFFHALSRQYLVSGLTAAEPAESFSTLSQALAHLGNLGELRLPLTAKKQFEPDTRHSVAMRAQLDIESLPTLMRPLAYVTPSWRLNTGWLEWPVQP